MTNALEHERSDWFCEQVQQHLPELRRHSPADGDSHRDRSRSEPRRVPVPRALRVAGRRALAHSVWQGGARSRTAVQGFHGAGQEDDSRQEPLTLEGDEPPVLLGSNTAPNAVEAVLHALASCLSIGFIYNAAAQGIEIDSLDMDLEGSLDLRAFLGLSEDVRPGYDGVTVNYRVTTDAPPEKVDELCAYVQRTSPVLDIISRPVPGSCSQDFLNEVRSSAARRR